MRIQKQQYDALVAKLDALQQANRNSGKEVEDAKAWRDKSFDDTRKWCTAIEQGLDKLLQSHAALDDHLAEHHNLTMNGSAEWRGRLSRIEANLDALQQEFREALPGLYANQLAIKEKLDAQNARLTEIGLDIGLHFRPAKPKKKSKR